MKVEARQVQGPLQLLGAPAGSDVHRDVLQDRDLGYGPQKVQCTEVRYPR